jgi:23S rRNA (pseudouridine1915-N3)-methyltransferase
MKTIRILSIRKNTSESIKTQEAEYMKRLGADCALEMIDIRQTYAHQEADGQVLAKEKELYTKKLGKNAKFVVLHESGKPLSSVDFSKWLNQSFSLSKQPLNFLIGSNVGIHQDLFKESEMVLSLSKMTFSHELARLLLLEQLYRAFDILKKGNYHK